MATYFRWMRRLRILFNARRVERAMREEMTHHLECETADRIRQGLSSDEARRAAILDFGGLERFKEEGRDARGGRLLEDIAADVGYAWRICRRAPTFTIAAVLTFALGIGAVTAIFSVVYGVVLRPLPYSEPGRLVAVWETSPERNQPRNVVAVDTFEAWRDRSRSFTAIAALVPRPVTVQSRSGPEREAGAEVSPGYFSLLGVSPALGREFTAAEAGEHVVMLSDAYWRRRFGADPSVLGHALLVSGVTYTIVGVMPRGFDPPQFDWLGAQDLWMPFAANATNRAWGRFLLVVGRLRPAVTIDRASRDVASLAEQMATTRGEQGWSALALGLSEQISGDVRPALFVLQGAALLLLIMATTNVAVLLLTHLQRRSPELVLRRAIGATSGRVFRQIFTQSAVLGVVGSVIGLYLAAPVVRVLRTWLPPDLPHAAAVQVDGAVLLDVGVLALAATVAFAAAAAWRATSANQAGKPVPQASMRVSPVTSGDQLAAVEIALGLVVAVLAGLMVRSVVALHSVDLGFAAPSVVVGRVAAVGPGYESADRQRAFFDALLAGVRSIPGVRSASLINIRPFGGAGPATSIRDPRQPIRRTDVPLVADLRVVDAEAFKALQVPLRAGMTFDEHDRPDASPRIVINEFLARTLFPSENPLGRHVAVDAYDGLTAEVIGVVADVHLIDARTPPRSTVYLAASRFASDVFDLIVRVNGAPESVVPELRRQLAARDPALPLYRVAPLTTLVDTALARDQFTMRLLMAFAAVSLALASVGIYGVFSGEVARRRREMGIRLMLGARPRSVVMLLFRGALRRALVGVAAGAIVAVVAARFMGSLLFGVAPTDPVSFAVMAALLLGLAALSTLAPSLRAGRVSPLAVTREG